MATSRRRKGQQAAAESHGKQIDLPNIANEQAQQANEASETMSLEQAGLDKLRALYPNGHPRFLHLLIEEARLHHDKNHDYAKGGPVFGNFERVAAILRLYPGFPYDTREGVNVTYLYVIWNTRRTLIQEELHGAL
ncbi:MAG: hypothetical protein LAP85_24440 [Acidobacteriia bacterium]|nr:hypothetical protein [Terriglobia bacterium]